MKSKSHRSGLTLALLATLALGVGFPSGLRAQQSDMPAMTAPTEGMPPLAEISGEDPLFEALGDVWTRDEFEGATRFFPPPALRILNELEVPFDRFLPSQIAKAIEEVVTNLAAGEAARERGMEVIEEELQQIMRDIAFRMWLRDKGVIEATIVSDEDVERFREDNREQLMLEETLRLRHMFFPAYEEVTVEDGDTLESISERINGDPAKASNILSMDNREPRAGEDAPDTGQTEPDLPLLAGEVLLVPMGEEAAAEIEAKVQAAWERINAGEDFIEVAKEATGNPNAATLITVKPATDTKPMLAPLREAFESIADGEFSKPVRTRHGFQIVFRESHQENRLMDLAEVRTRHLMDIRERKAYDAFIAAIKATWKEFDGVEIDEEVLMSAGTEDADNSAAIFTLNSGPYTVGQFMAEHGENIEELETLEQRRDALVQNRLLHEPIMLWDIERLGIRESRDFELARRVVEATLLTPKAIETISLERLEEPTEEDLRERFAADVDRLTQVPSAYVWRITVTADTDAEPGTEEYRSAVRVKMQELSRILSEIQDVSHFERIAREMSEDEFATMGGRVGRVNSFQEDGTYKPVIERMEGRGSVGPFINGRDLQGYWVEEVFSTSETMYQDVRHLVHHNEVSERRMRISRQVERGFTESAQLKYLFDASDPADPEENGAEEDGAEE